MAPVFCGFFMSRTFILPQRFFFLDRTQNRSLQRPSGGAILAENNKNPRGNAAAHGASPLGEAVSGARV
jgi:hypothetical protein